MWNKLIGIYKRNKISVTIFIVLVSVVLFVFVALSVAIATIIGFSVFVIRGKRKKITIELDRDPDLNRIHVNNVLGLIEFYINGEDDKDGVYSLISKKYKNTGMAERHKQFVLETGVEHPFHLISSTGFMGGSKISIRICDVLKNMPLSSHGIDLIQKLIKNKK